MNKVQWLQVWGFDPATPPEDRRSRASPFRLSDRGKAFTAFLRRATDRQYLQAMTEETVEV